MFIRSNWEGWNEGIYDKLQPFVDSYSPTLLTGDVDVASRATHPQNIPEKDIPIAGRDKCMERFDTETVRDVLHMLIPHFPDKFINVSGHWFYPKNGGYMGWHTNSDAPYERLYLVYSETGESWFKYKKENGDVEEVKDKKGWNVYNFTTPEYPLFWHCVEAKCNRWSFGFRML